MKTQQEGVIIDLCFQIEIPLCATKARSLQKLQEVMSKWSPEGWEELAQGGGVEVNFGKRIAHFTWKLERPRHLQRNEEVHIQL